MIVAMPNTRELAARVPPKPGELDDCSREFLQDIVPYIDGHYRTKPNRENRAAGRPSQKELRYATRRLTQKLEE